MCLECGHTFEVYTDPDDEDVEFEAVCPICGSGETNQVDDEVTELDEEDLGQEESPDEPADPCLGLDDE